MQLLSTSLRPHASPYSVCHLRAFFLTGFSQGSQGELCISGGGSLLRCAASAPALFRGDLAAAAGGTGAPVADLVNYVHPDSHSSLVLGGLSVLQRPAGR